MKSRPVLIVLGILIFAVLMFFGFDQKENIKMLDQEIASLNGNIQQLESEKSELTRKEGELKKIVETIPPSLLMGFEDPEAGFVQFLDYLRNPILDATQTEISLRDPQKFTATPVPLHSSEFSFKFMFFSTHEAEKLFNYLLLQQQYPLRIGSLVMKRSKEGQAEGTLNASLLIPAKLTLPSATEKKEGQ